MKTEINKDTVTAFPVMEAVGRLDPGVYVMTAKLPGKTERDDEGDRSGRPDQRAIHPVVPP